jgi:hypothetical protein
LEIVLEDDDLKRKCFGVIAGAGTHDGNARNLFLYVKFYNPLERADFRCTRMEMM